MLNLCEHSRAEGFSHFFYGGVPGVAEQLQDQMMDRFPGLKVVGTYTPPFRRLNDQEIHELQERVRYSRPDFFWVGLGTPKQERFMAQFWPQLTDGTIKPIIDSVYPIAQANEAHQQMAENQNIGKIILKVRES